MDKSPVETFLQNANFLQGIAGITRSLCWGTAIFVGACLVAIGSDALFALPAWVRLAIDIILLVAGLLVVVNLWSIARSALKFNQRKVARHTELMLGIEDNAIINAVDFSGNHVGHSSPALRTQVVEHGRELSNQFSFLETVRLAPMFWACLALVMLVASTVVTYLINPLLFHRVAPRYLDVFGNHPAYTALVFEVQYAPQQIYQGQSAIIDVNIDGMALPANANLIQRFEDQPLSTPMINVAPGKFQLELNDLQSTVEFHVETDTGTSPPFVLDVIPVPQFKNVWLQYDYPAYTNWPSKRRQLDSRGISALNSTQIHVEVESSIKLAQGRMTALKKDRRKPSAEPTSEETITLNTVAHAPTTATGQLKLTNQSWFEISLEGANGSTSQQPLSGNITVNADRPPRISFTTPDPHIIAVEDWQIPVKLQFSDDVGLRNVDLFRSVNGLGPYAKTIAKSLSHDHQNQTSGAAEFEFDLADLGAKAGDVITYYATVSDTFPTDWPNSADHVSSTDTYVIQVISADQYKQLARQHYRMDDVLAEIDQIKQELDQLQEQRNELLDKLKQLQAKLESGESLTDEEQQQLENLTEQLQDFASATNELAERMQQRSQQIGIYDFEEKYQETLKELSQQLQKQSANAQQLAQQLQPDESSSPAADAQSLRDAIKMFRTNNAPFDEENQEERENLQSDMEKLAGAEEMLQTVAELKNIIEQQRLIADRMKEFANQTELSDQQQQRLKRLAKQQDLLKGELEDVIKAMGAAAHNARQDFPKASQSLLDMIDAIKASEVGADQQQATESGLNSDGKRAHASAQQAARKLEALQCDCDGNSLGKEMAQGDRPLSIPKNGMNNSLQQLAQSMQLPSLGSGKQGKSGAGYRGSMAKATLYGPHQPSHSQSMAQSGGKRRGGKGRGTGRGAVNQSVAAENLTPEARTGQTTGPSNMRGVPSQYIEHARGYLRRITEVPDATSAPRASSTPTNSQ